MKPNPLASQILVISGWRGVGKTTLCQRLVASARDAGWEVSGLVSPARVENSLKTGIMVEDLRTGQRRLLASCLEGELQGIRLGPWTFDDGVFDWGNQVLLSALPCDMLVLDEIGPLEFDRSQGWLESFRVLASNSYQLAIVVVRPECVDLFLERWKVAEIYNLKDQSGMDKLEDEIVSLYIGRTR